MTNSVEPVTASKLPIFICYRQSDGKDVAAHVFNLLHDQRINGTDPEQSSLQLDVYFDQRAPGVDDWTAIHEPYLKRARAFILVCSPGAKIREGDDDWVHREIDWWIENRGPAPILIDPLGEGSRYVPDRVARKWPKAQRIELIDRQWNRLPADELIAEQSKIFERIVGGIASSVADVYREEMEREKARRQELQTALDSQRRLSRNLKYTLAGAVLLLVLTAAATLWALRQSAVARTNFDASIAVVRRVTDQFLLQTLHTQGYPGSETAQMLQSISTDLSAIDPGVTRPDVQVLRYRIMQGLAYQNQFQGTGDDVAVLLECRGIVQLMIRAAPERIAEINALSCLDQVLLTMSLAHTDMLRERYERICDLDYTEVVGELVVVANLLAQEGMLDAKLRAELAERIDESERSSLKLLFACPNVREAPSTVFNDLKAVLASSGD